MEYVEIELEVSAANTVSARRQGGAVAHGVFRLSASHRALINIFDLWLRERKITRSEEMRAFGSLLYETLLDVDVDQLFMQSLDAMTGDDRLRLQLIFRQGTDELASLPWEFLYRPDREAREGFFLATHRRLVLSRYIPLETDRRRLAIEEDPVRFLVVLSQPASLDPVLANPVMDEIEKLGGTYAVEIKRLINPTIDDFADTLEEYRPRVVHFMGHGNFDASTRRGEIALLKADKEQPAWVSDATFAGYFESAPPRLVVLHACHGGAVDFASRFSGLAPQIFRRKVPAVVAMQYAVTNETAIKFSRTFYRELADGAPVDGAFQEARLRITRGDTDAHGNRDFGTPILYMHGRDGLMMPLRKKAGEEG